MYRRVDREFGRIDIVANIPGANILGDILRRSRLNTSPECSTPPW